MNFLFNGESINYDYICGKQNTILFLHGWGGNKHSFKSLISLCKNKFNIIAITLPTTKETNKVWSVPLYATAVESILKSHNITSCDVVCHSFGFRVASLMNKKLINKLIVTGGAGIKSKCIFRRILLENKVILNKNPRFNGKWLNIANNDYLSLSSTNKQSFKNIVNLNTVLCSKFNCKMLLFWGKNDTDTPLFIAKKLKRINKCNLIVTNGNHFAYLQQSALFNNLAIRFLNGNDYS